MSKKIEDREKLGERLQEERKYRGYSQQEIADYLGISRSSVSLIESGERKIDSIELQNLADFYNTTIDKLVNDSPNDSQNDDISLIARKAENLSEEDREEVLKFAEFLNSQNTEVGDNESA